LKCIWPSDDLKICYFICRIPGDTALWLVQVIVADRNLLFVVFIDDLLSSNLWQFMSAGLVFR